MSADRSLWVQHMFSIATDQKGTGDSYDLVTRSSCLTRKWVWPSNTLCTCKHNTPHQSPTTQFCSFMDTKEISWYENIEYPNWWISEGTGKHRLLSLLFDAGMDRNQHSILLAKIEDHLGGRPFIQSDFWHSLHWCISISAVPFVQTHCIIICLLHKICCTYSSNKLPLFFWLLAWIICIQPWERPDQQQATYKYCNQDRRVLHSCLPNMQWQAKQYLWRYH